MCEFCSLGPNSRQHGGDATDLRFAGFFSAEAIDSAVRQAEADRNSSSSSSDNGVSNRPGGRDAGSDDEEVGEEEDDDGT